MKANSRHFKLSLQQHHKKGEEEEEEDPSDAGTTSLLISPITAAESSAEDDNGGGHSDNSDAEDSGLHDVLNHLYPVADAERAGEEDPLYYSDIRRRRIQKQQQQLKNKNQRKKTVEKVVVLSSNKTLGVESGGVGEPWLKPRYWCNCDFLDEPSPPTAEEGGGEGDRGGEEVVAMKTQEGDAEDEEEAARRRMTALVPRTRDYFNVEGRLPSEPATLIPKKVVGIFFVFCSIWSRFSLVLLLVRSFRGKEARFSNLLQFG